MTAMTRIVRDILRHKGSEVYTISPGATVFDALRLMSDKDVGGLVVLEQGRIVGVISERDYARKVILKGKQSQDTPVREIMTEKVITVDPTMNLEKCMELMTHHRFRHLPVIENGEMVGIVSIGDIVKGIINSKEFVIEQLENYIKGSP